LTIETHLTGNERLEAGNLQPNELNKPNEPNNPASSIQIIGTWRCHCQYHSGLALYRTIYWCIDIFWHM